MNIQELTSNKTGSAENEKPGIRIRTATVRDAEPIQEIYAPYVQNTAITFEYEVPSVSDFTDRISRTLMKYPFLVAESGSRIVGYAYAGPFQDRAAYNWSAETSVYIPEGWKRQGIGTALYTAMEKSLAAQNVTNLYACLAFPKTVDKHLGMDSIYFHEHFGFQVAGEFKQCGYKFNRWYDMIWMEKIIGEHREIQPPFQVYHAVAAPFMTEKAEPAKGKSSQ